MTTVNELIKHLMTLSNSGYGDYSIRVVRASAHLRFSIFSHQPANLVQLLVNEDEIKKDERAVLDAITS